MRENGGASQTVTVSAMKDIGKRHHVRLPAHQHRELLQRRHSAVGKGLREILLHGCKLIFCNRAAPSHALVQARQMQIETMVEQRIDHREADGTAEVSRQIVKSRRILQLLRRQRAERQIVDRHHAQHQRAAAQDLRQQQFVEVPVGRDAGRDVGSEPRSRRSRSAS